MFNKAQLIFLVLGVLSTSVDVEARERWFERDNKPIYLHPRRFGQEQPAVIQKLSGACPGQVCGVLAGAAITPLLAAQPECSQQDMADQIIDAAAQFDDATKANMIALAIEYRKAEKNTPPDFTTNPPTPRNSVFCQKAPKNSQLNGLVQAQDPANGDVFFDPATKASVQRGAQANTAPFGGAGAPPPVVVPAPTSVAAEAPSTTQSDCPVDVTVTVTATGAVDLPTDAITVSVTGTATPSATTVTAAPAPTGGNIGNFGSCSIPEIEFAAGFDGRRETSFQPKDKASYNHGSAQNIAIITRAMCDQLVNTCRADQTAKDTCARATAAAATGAAKTGIQADLFNAVFGITTNFAAVQQIDDQGRAVGGTGIVISSTGAASAPAATATGTGSTAVNFGSCSTPQIEFGAGFDDRRETSFQPTDKASFNHGSAQNSGIITQFICDQLTNSCKANQAAKDLCQTARTATAAAAAGKGVQADVFNAAFGITTNFAAVAQIDNQGNVVGGGAAATTKAAAATTSTTAAAPPATTAAFAPPATTTAVAPSVPTTPAAAVPPTSGANLQTFTKALGGVVAPSVFATADGKFQVTGNSAINDSQNAVVRSCDVQNNACARVANANRNAEFSVADCAAQQSECIALARA